MIERGKVYRFSYLWTWQSALGEESGRTVRTVCLVMKTRKPNGNLFLFPVTTSLPAQDRLAIDIPNAERKLAGLDMRSWIVLDEYNQATEAAAYDFESLDPTGHFSDHFFRKIAETVKLAILSGRIKAVPRT
jgi:hypothetical protein